jgi:hypothetical protein
MTKEDVVTERFVYRARPEWQWVMLIHAGVRVITREHVEKAA